MPLSPTQLDTELALLEQIDRARREILALRVRRDASQTPVDSVTVSGGGATLAEFADPDLIAQAQAALAAHYDWQIEGAVASVQSLRQTPPL